jgi:haloalkane dehalogenase
MEILRTPEQRFDAWIDFPFDARYIEWQGLRMHYVDEGPADGPVMLMCHGMPTSSYLYRRMIPPLVAAGYRCIAADCIGFGKSDKVLDDAWYSIEKHSESITFLIQNLEIERITLICQDWGGPIGLRQAVDMPARFDRLTIMNTWLHHPEYQYTQALRDWNAGWHPGGRFDESQACGLVMQMITSNNPGSPLTPEQAFAAYEAPFPDRASKAGPRRFPLSLPFDNPEGGNATQQTRCFGALADWEKPIHFIWGLRDDVFNETWCDEWASCYSQSTVDKIADAPHFLQETHGPEIVEHLLRRIGEE